MLNDITKLNIENLPKILLIFGEEEFLVEESLEYVRSSIIPKITDTYDLDVFNGDEIDAIKLVDIARSFPFMSEKRCIVVKNVENLLNLQSKKNNSNQIFTKYLEAPSDSTFLVLTSNYSGLNGITKKLSTQLKTLKSPFRELIEKYEWIEHPKVWENQLFQWLKSQFKKKKVDITDPALNLILVSTNPNLRDISNEIQKLWIYTKDAKNITENDVILSTGISRKYNVYELQKAIGNADLTKSLEIAENLISNERAEMLILSVISRFMLALLKLYEVIENTNKYEVASIVGTNPYFIDEYKRALKKLGIKRIENSFKYLAETDSNLKTISTDSKNLILKMIINILS